MKLDIPSDSEYTSYVIYTSYITIFIVHVISAVVQEVVWLPGRATSGSSWLCVDVSLNLFTESPNLTEPLTAPDVQVWS